MSPKRANEQRDDCCRFCACIKRMPVLSLVEERLVAKMKNLEEKRRGVQEKCVEANARWSFSASVETM